MCFLQVRVRIRYLPWLKMSNFPFRYWEFFWYLCVAIIGGIGNLIVLVVIVKNKKMKRSSPFNMYIFALGLTDWFASLIGLPNYILSTDIFKHPVGVNGDVICKLFTGYFWTFWLLEMSVILLVLISIERRNAVLNPFSTLEESSLKKTLAVIFGAILISFIISVPNIVGVIYDMKNARGGNFCRYKFTYFESSCIYGVIFVTDTIIPFGIIIRCFYDIKTKLKKTDDLIKPALISKEDSNSYKKDKGKVYNPKIKTTETLQLVVIAFFICIIPNQVLYVLSFANIKGVTWNSEIYQIAVLLRFSNSCINPILYSFYSSNFRQNFYTVFKTFQGREQPKNVFPGGDLFAIKHRSQSLDSNIESSEIKTVI